MTKQQLAMKTWLMYSKWNKNQDVFHMLKQPHLIIPSKEDTLITYKKNFCM